MASRWLRIIGFKVCLCNDAAVISVIYKLLQAVPEYRRYSLLDDLKLEQFYISEEESNGLNVCVKS